MSATGVANRASVGFLPVFGFLVLTLVLLSVGSASAAQDPLLRELQDASPRAMPRPMLDIRGRPSGNRRVPSPRRSTVIGRRIDSGADFPAARHANILNWRGFPKKINSPVGKIWVYLAGRKWIRPYCSGTVFSRSVVITAAHCVTDRQRRYHRRILFVPGQTWDHPSSTDVADIRARWGVWEAENWWAPAAYQNGSSNLDWGLIEIKPKTGRYIGDVVGTYRVQAGSRFLDGVRVWSFGYPAAGSFWSSPTGFMGRTQYACNATWSAGAWRRNAGGDELWIRCPMNGGSSGGPWLVRLRSGEWVIRGVNNWCNDEIKSDDEDTYCTPVSTHLRSLIFDGRFVSFWKSVVPRLRY